MLLGPYQLSALVTLWWAPSHPHSHIPCAVLHQGAFHHPKESPIIESRPGKQLHVAWAALIALRSLLIYSMSLIAYWHWLVLRWLRWLGRRETPGINGYYRLAKTLWLLVWDSEIRAKAAMTNVTFSWAIPDQGNLQIILLFWIIRLSVSVMFATCLIRLVPLIPKCKLRRESSSQETDLGYCSHR